MKNRIKTNRMLINEELKDVRVRRYFSPASFGIYRAIRTAIAGYANGKLIDVGCGDMSWENLAKSFVEQYDTFDVERRSDKIKFIGDIHDMHMIEDETYDSALCLEVLEHSKDPFKAISEIARILKGGGNLIISVPHLSRLHEEPHDFYRYTRYGLEHILKTAGFEPLSIVAHGGIFSFLGHQFSTVFLCSFWHIPLVKVIVFVINVLVSVLPCHVLDQLFDKKKVFALGYVCVATKPVSGCNT